MNEPKSAILRYGLPRIQDVLFAALFLAVIGLGSRLMNVDGDLGRHLTIGNTIWENARVPIQDIYSHTMPGKPLVPHEWLSQVIFAFAYHWVRVNPGQAIITWTPW